MELEISVPGVTPDVPLVLAKFHATLPVGARMTVTAGSLAGGGPPLADLVAGAGFEVDDDAGARVSGRRARSLADTVGPGLRLLVCGLNPSLVAADAGYGYAGRSNRFWPAALAAGLVSRPRDPAHALSTHGLGMTDVVKRATPAASALAPQEYRDGLERVRRLVEWLTPPVLLFVGLAGWRAAVDRRALPGWQPQGLAGTPTYVMPSTSGLNARTPLAELVEHMQSTLAGPRRVSRGGQ